jgi:NAD(P)H dehydrogenase (quinone)
MRFNIGIERPCTIIEVAEGKMPGTRAFLVVTIRGWREHYSARAITGPIDDLFPVNHGMLYYAGFEFLPSFVVYQAD